VAFPAYRPETSDNEVIYPDKEDPGNCLAGEIGRRGRYDDTSFNDEDETVEVMKIWLSTIQDLKGELISNFDPVFF
jgi:hypothetical protein